MAKKTCKNGHIYDSNIYGDNCPFCPSSNGGTVINEGNSDKGTSLNKYDEEPTKKNEEEYSTGPTVPLGDKGGLGGGTVIRRPGSIGGNDTSIKNGRRLVGFLVTYNANPLGVSFNIYEGRNYIGSTAINDICISNDNTVSGKHMSILYRAVDQKFKFRDEQSSNGTFVNEVLEDEGELKDHDIIHIGSTYLIFIAIPQSLNM